MRTIKFRGKCAKDSRYAGEWVYGACVQCEKSDDVLIIYAINDQNSCSYHVDPDTVGQFTGLLDKNGREVYEGDIVKHGTFIGVVDWHPIGNFFINENYGKRQDKCISLGEMLENHYFIVVGNIHDNPYLMEGGEQ